MRARKENVRQSPGSQKVPAAQCAMAMNAPQCRRSNAKQRDNRAVQATAVREQVLGVDVLPVKENELAMAQAPVALNDQGVIVHWRRHVRDVGELTESVREEGLARLHVGRALTGLQCTRRVPQQYAADEDVEDAAFVPV